jgi:Xaa-Pro aminopeptidase
MAETPAPFDPGEFHRRRAVLQAGMAGDGLDALLLSAPADIAWITGLATRFWQSPCRAWFVVVPAKGDPVAVIPEIGCAPMARTWLDDIRSYPSPGEDGIDGLLAALAACVSKTGRIGLPMGAGTAPAMPLASWLRLETALRPRCFVDAGSLVAGARAIKSEAEIARIRAAARAGRAAFAGLPALAGPGRRIADVARAFQAAVLEAGADHVGYLAAVAGPGGYGDVIDPGDSRILVPGDVLLVDLGAVVGGYYCDFGRNVAIGPPSAAVRDAHRALHDAVAAGIAAARPGITAADLHGVMAGVLQAAGQRPGGGRFGHGIGLSLTEPPSLMPGDRTVLEAGMVLALEPGVTLGPGRLLVAEENIVLRGDGAALLTDPAGPTMAVAE